MNDTDERWKSTNREAAIDTPSIYICSEVPACDEVVKVHSTDTLLAGGANISTAVYIPLKS